MAIFNLTDREFQNVLDIGGRGISAAGSFLESRGAAAALDANAQIASLNAREIAETLPIQIEGIEQEIISEQEAAAIEERRTTENLSRARRQATLSEGSFEAETQLVTTSRRELELRSEINDRLLGTTLDAITIRANERARVLAREKRDRTAEIRSIAAAGNVRVTSGSIAAAEDDVKEDIDAAVGAIRADELVSRQEARIRDELTDSNIREQLASIDNQLAQIDLEEIQLRALLEDATFDAALESEINIRNRDINIDRLERSRELLERKAAIGVETFQRQQDLLEDQEDDQLIADILSGAGFGVDVLTKFPSLAGKLGNLLGITGSTSLGGGIAGGTGLTGQGLNAGLAALEAANTAAAVGTGTASTAAAVGTGEALFGSAAFSGGGTGTAVSTGTAVGAGAASGAGSAGLTTFSQGLSASLGLGGGSIAPAVGGTFTGTAAAFLGTVAPPIAAILGIMYLGGAFSTDNTALAQQIATDKTVDLLRTGHNLERAKALLGLPNTFKDPNPGTGARIWGVENLIKQAGGIESLPPESRAILESALELQTDRLAQQNSAARTRLGLPASNDQLRQSFPGGGGQTYADTLAGQLIQQGLSPIEVEQRVMTQGSGA